MHRSRISIFVFSATLCAVHAATPGPAALAVMVAGNGQVVQEEYETTVPLTIRVTDEAGIPVSGVPVSWSIAPQDAQLGTLNQPVNQTDSNGLATANFIGSAIQPGASFAQAVLNAATSVGTVSFTVTVVPTPPSVLFNAPTFSSGFTVTGPGGTTLPGAVVAVVEAQSGIGLGSGIPNVAMFIADANDANTPPAVCNAPEGTVLTSSNGTATCDLVLGNTPGTYFLHAAIAGGVRPFTLTITPGQSCTFVLSSQSATVAAAGGNGSVNVTAASGCTWTADTSSNFITITSGASGSGNGTVNYSVAANSGSARSATVSIAGQTFTVNQSGSSGPAPLTIVTGSNLPGGIATSAYSAALSASGGQPPYSWQVTAGSLPSGLTLTSSSGAIGGTPASAGTTTVTITVTDSAGGVQSQAFTIAVAPAGTGITITNSGFPNGTAGVPYQQVLTYASAQCGSPFAAPPAFAFVSGTLPIGLSVQSIGDGYAISGTPTAAGIYNFTLSVSNSCGQTGTGAFSITINGPGNTSALSANPQSLTFNVVQTGQPQAQQVLVSSSGGSVGISINSSTSSGGSWFGVALSAQTTPATLNVTIGNYLTLTPGTYQGSITVLTPNLASLTIPVTLNVTAAALSVTPNALTFTLPLNTTAQQTVSFSAGSSAEQIASTAVTASGGNWLTVLPASGTTPGTATVSANTSGLTAGKYMGTVTIAAPGASVQVQVTLNVTPITLAVDEQSLTFAYTQGATTPPASSTVNIISSGAAVPVAITASTVSGGTWLFVTPSGGQAATAVTVSVSPSGLAVGTYTGAVMIAPTDPAINTIQIPVTLTVSPGAGPVINGVTNAASGTPGQVSPGEFITIYGSAMAQSTPSKLTLTAANTISTSLAGTQVLFDGIAAPLTYVSATQINAIVPYELYGKTATQLQVAYNSVPSTPVSLGVATSAPGIFIGPPPNASAQAAALNQDFSVNSSTNGAAAGSTIILYGTGEGQTSPTGVTGSITGATLPLPLPLLPVTVRIGGLPAVLEYAGEAPGLAAGLFQVNAQIPDTVPHGTQVPVTITIGDVISNRVSIAIAP
ncbi:MAG: putative Ig domain-containing protein [Bryobacteraceae bacterium]